MSNPTNAPGMNMQSRTLNPMHKVPRFSLVADLNLINPNPPPAWARLLPRHLLGLRVRVDRLI